MAGAGWGEGGEGGFRTAGRQNVWWTSWTVLSEGRPCNTHMEWKLVKLHVCNGWKNKNYLLDGWQKTRVEVTGCKADEVIVKGRWEAVELDERESSGVGDKVIWRWAPSNQSLTFLRGCSALRAHFLLVHCVFVYSVLWEHFRVAAIADLMVG